MKITINFIKPIFITSIIYLKRVFGSYIKAVKLNTLYTWNTTCYLKKETHLIDCLVFDVRDVQT